MSLEQTLAQTNELLTNLINILNTGIQAQGTFGKPEVTAAEATTKRGPGRPKKDAAAPAEKPAGTVYWHVPRYNTVFAQEPGMAAPTSDDAVQITQEEYVAKKAAQEALTDAAIANHSKPATTTSATPSPSPAPAPSQPTAEVVVVAAPDPSTAQPAPQPSTAQAAAANSASDDVPFAAVMDAAKAVNAVPAKGRELLMGVLKSLLPNEPQPTVTKLQGAVANSVAVAALKAALPAAEAEFDPLA